MSASRWSLRLFPRPTTRLTCNRVGVLTRLWLPISNVEIGISISRRDRGPARMCIALRVLVGDIEAAVVDRRADRSAGRKVTACQRVASLGVRALLLGGVWIQICLVVHHLLAVDR